jgi:serine/threonine protein kinase
MGSIELSASIRDFLLKEDALDSFELHGRKYRADSPKAHGFLGVVWKVFDEHNRPRAAKFTTNQEFENKSYLQEISLAAKLEPYAQFARFADAGPVQLNVPEKTTFICFIEEWVEGATLKQLLEKESLLITPSFLLAYVQQLSNVLSILGALQLRHDDLHAGNVMIVPPGPGDLSQVYSVKIIDTGSLKNASLPLRKPLDDHLQFVKHLIMIRNLLIRRKLLTHNDRKFVAEVDRLIHSMAEEDPSIALREPTQIVEAFESQRTKASAARTDTAVEMSNPFEFISAEHIADDRLLEQIFAESCPWLEKIAGADPCLVTGPRGCGKSTIFRWLSLKTHLHKEAPQIERFKITGFYISCSIDLQNRLGWITSDAQAESLKYGIIHYFNLIVAREVLHTLIRISRRDDRESFWQFGKNEESAVHEFILKSIQSTTRRLQGVPKLVQALELVEMEMYNVHSDMLRGKLNPDHCSAETFIGDFTTILVQKIPHFGRKKIAFLVDDFSVHRISEPVQKILNRVIWERRGSHVFKLSSEKHGAVLVDVRNASADLTREMTEIDCGKEYISLDDVQHNVKAKRFALELLQNRLRAAGYRGSAEILLGHSKWGTGSLAKALVSKRIGRKDDHYHGIEVISQLCSGDVSSLLFVYRQIFESAGVTKEYTALIPKHTQSSAIKEVSRKMTEATRLTHPHGADCYAVLLAFGRLVRLILKEGAPQRMRDGKTVPTQAPRIELDRSTASDTLTGTLVELEKELLRRAVFIDLDIGTSRHQSRPTIRWHLRRIYLPTFSAALSKNNAVKRSYDWLKFFLSAPDGACEDIWRTWPRPDTTKSTRRKNNSSTQEKLPL